jgi:hypothetical protein
VSPIGGRTKERNVNEEGGCGGDARFVKECVTHVRILPGFSIVTDPCSQIVRTLCDYEGTIEVLVAWSTGSMNAVYEYQNGELLRPSIISEGEVPKEGAEARVEVKAHADAGHYDVRIVTRNHAPTP